MGGLAQQIANGDNCARRARIARRHDVVGPRYEALSILQPNEDAAAFRTYGFDDQRARLGATMHPRRQREPNRVVRRKYDRGVEQQRLRFVV